MQRHPREAGRSDALRLSGSVTASGTRRAARAAFLPLVTLLTALTGGCGAGGAARADGEVPDVAASGAGLPAAERDGAFPIWNADFERYRADTRAWLAARAMPQRGARDIALNLPFERSADPAAPYLGRFLLFHGLNDSPAVWHDFADALVARGYDVRAILFAGHGSTPEDMLEVRWESWMEAARRWMTDWLPGLPGNENAVPLYLGGFSMGGVVATRLALDEPRLSGLLLLSPAYRSRLDRYLRFAGLYAMFEPWVFGGMILEDNPIKYNSIPVNSGWQFHRLTRFLARRWRPDDRIDVPTLLVHSSEDSVVDTAYTRALFQRRFTADERLMITYVPGGLAPGEKPGTHEEVRDSHHPEHRILGQSHLSLTNAPDNPLFGESGRVRVCNGNEYPVFMACMRATDHWYGAQKTPSPDGTPVARVTWNPDWDHVLHRFDEVFPPRAQLPPSPGQAASLPR